MMSNTSCVSFTTDQSAEFYCKKQENTLLVYFSIQALKCKV